MTLEILCMLAALLVEIEDAIGIEGDFKAFFAVRIGRTQKVTTIDRECGRNSDLKGDGNGENLGGEGG